MAPTKRRCRPRKLVRGSLVVPTQGVGLFGELHKRPFSGQHECLATEKGLSQNGSDQMVSKGDKTAADAARPFKIHPATVCRLLARSASTKKASYAK